MKRYAPLFIAIASVFSCNCFAQRSAQPANDKTDNAQLLADNTSNNGLAVVSYHVEERINMAFGSSVTTYDVSSLSLINTNDLGENNVRVVTPRYAKVRAKALPVALINAQPKTAVAAITAPIKLLKIDELAKEEKKKYVSIDVLNTYERVLEKGYKSTEMLLRVANSRYFEGNLILSAKWYGELFAMTTDLDPVYYYRYGQSLKAAGDLKKAAEMMKLFDTKSHSEK
jgi:hypothetical protein